MSEPLNRPWPPPPDLPSIQELVRSADVEGHLADGAAQDEYEPEEELLFRAIHALPTNAIVQETLLPHLERIWRDSFQLNDEALAERRPKLLALAKEIERFFGPESKPVTRGDILARG